MKLIQGNYEKAYQMCREEFGDRFFDFCFVHTRSGAEFREIDRFLWESRHLLAKFKNRYSGPVVIDLSQWSDNYPNEYFEAFLYFLKHYEGEMQYIMISESECRKEIVEEIESLFTVENIVLEKKIAKKQIGFIDKEETDYV